MFVASLYQFMMRLNLVSICLMICFAARAQTDLTIFAERAENGFQDWSWGTHNLSSTTPVHSGSYAISTSFEPWQAISFHHSEMDTSPYTNLTFWAHGGTAGGQKLQVYGEYGTNSSPAYVLPTALPANSWQQFTIPLQTLGLAAKKDFHRLNLQLRSDGASGSFHLDDISLKANPAPAYVNVSVNPIQVLQQADQRHFGVNLAMWDSYYDPPYHTTTANLLKEMGCTVVRMPGGSLSDEYHWAVNKTLNNTWEWAASFADMVRVATNAGVQAFITVNYGSGTPQEAAAWVRHANVTNRLGYKFWEIGNECYGDWETDQNTNPHDPVTYASRAKDYIAQMKAVDPTIKIGVVAVPGENSFSNQFTALHPANNPRTGKTSYGWTPIMLRSLKSLGVTPDFLAHHVYPQWTDKANPASSPDNDVSLLNSTGNWAKDAADLRQQIADYFGEGGENIELVCTENNSDAGAQGKQSTSLVNGLYYADSLAQLLRTEFKGFVWWDLRNGSDTQGYFGSELYGWRSYGDLGMINGEKTKHPAFYAAKLMQWFARPGDRILEVASDYQWISAHAAQRSNGVLSVLFINKSLTTDLTTQVQLQGYTPDTNATVRFYGIPQDEAARNNLPAAAQDVTTSMITNAGPGFTLNLPRLSMTVVSLTPAPARLLASPVGNESKFVMKIQGSPGVPYTLQVSTNLVNWTSFGTNTTSGTTIEIPDVNLEKTRFWRAMWQQ